MRGFQRFLLFPRAHLFWSVKMSMDIELDQGEYKRLWLTFTTAGVIGISAAQATPALSSGRDVSGATITFLMKRQRDDSTAIVSKTNSDMTSGGTGIEYFFLTDTETADLEGSYMGEAKAIFSATDIAKQKFTIWFREAVG